MRGPLRPAEARCCPLLLCVWAAAASGTLSVCDAVAGYLWCWLCACRVCVCAEWTRTQVIVEENMRAPSGCQASTYAPHCADVGEPDPTKTDCMQKFDLAAKSVCDKLCEWHRWADFETDMANLDGALALVGFIPIPGASAIATGAAKAVATTVEKISALSAIAQADGATQADNWAVTGSANVDLTIALSQCVNEIPQMIADAIADVNLEDYRDKWLECKLLMPREPIHSSNIPQIQPHSTCLRARARRPCVLCMRQIKRKCARCRELWSHGV